MSFRRATAGERGQAGGVDRSSAQRRSWPGLCAGVALGLALVTTQGLGAPLTVAIEVEREHAALECPDRAELKRRVEHILQRRLKRGASHGDTIRIEVEFRRVQGEYVADLGFGGAKPGERTLRDRGPGCGALADAVSITIGLVLDRELDQPAAVQPAPVPARPTPAPRPSAPDRALTSELRASSGAGLAWGFADRSSPLVTTDLGLRVAGRWLFAAGFDAILPGSNSFGAGEVRTSLLRGTLRACHAAGDRFLFGPCALAGAGRLHGVGIGYDDERSRNLLWTAVGASVVAEGPVWGELFWGMSATIWKPLRQQSFSVENAGTAWQSTPFATALSLRAGVRVWWVPPTVRRPRQARFVGKFAPRLPLSQYRTLLP